MARDRRQRTMDESVLFRMGLDATYCLWMVGPHGQVERGLALVVACIHIDAKP